MRFGFGRFLAPPFLLRFREPIKIEIPIPIPIKTTAIGIIGRLEPLASTVGIVDAGVGEALPPEFGGVAPLAPGVEMETGSGIALVSISWIAEADVCPAADVAITW